MLTAVTGGGRSADFATGVRNLARFVLNVLQSRSEARLDERPGACVLVFFLRPGNLCVLVKVQLLDQLCVRERRKLFHSYNCDVFLAQFLSFGNQIVVDLT